MKAAGMAAGGSAGGDEATVGAATLHDSDGDIGGDGDAAEQKAKRPRGARGARHNSRRRRCTAKSGRRDGLEVGAE